MKKTLLKILSVNILHKIAMIILVSSFSVSLFAQGKVTGKITDEAGEPLAGASIIQKGTNNGVSANASGDYSINVSGNNATLVVSLMGYETQETAVGGRTVINVTLAEDLNKLEEVVVTAMGIRKDTKKLGYAVSSINAGELTKVGSPNFATALYGKASGVRITAPPGGSASGVSINIRGINSINGNTQPMIFLNGVPIRNGNSDDTYASFGSESRIRANGLVDINPEDIENLTILKGASATALYGSEAANGVVMITSKKAKGSGITVDANVTLEVNTLAYLPKVQNEFGPGSFTPQLDEYNLTHDRFSHITYEGTDYTIPRWTGGVTHIWGPKYDGRQVLYWDGKTRAYSSINDDPWKELFRTGTNQIYNVAINQGSENSTSRFSYTFVNESPNGLTGSYNKHNFNLIGNLKIGKRISVEYSGNYIIQNYHNRAQSSTGAYDSFSNLFSTFTDIDLMKKMYKTSLGYRNVDIGEDTQTPNESFKVAGIQQIKWLRDYFWGAYENNDYETDNRFIGSVAPSWQITDWLTLRGRVSSDLTSDNIEYKNATERSLTIGDPTGGYRIVNKDYSIYHGDVMLMFDKNVTEKINIAANIGWQGRSENSKMLTSWTDGGLTAENTFLLTVSRNNVRTEQNRMELLKTAFLGSIDFSYDDYLFLGVTGRQEKSSTLPKGSNTYFYPSANASFIYTAALKDAMPSWYNFGKLRFSYGIVGNAPAAYAANIVYDVGTGGGVSWSHVPGTLGNEALRPEKITEAEVGLESKFFGGRLGFEVSLYSRSISDMIIQLPIPSSDGASNMWTNVGEMQNRGVEVSLNVSPIVTRDFSWDIHTNLSFNRNKIISLMDGVDYLGNNGNFGNSGGGVGMRSYAGRPMGDIYVAPVRKVEDKASPFYGREIIDIDGYIGTYSHRTGSANMEAVGNVTPKVIGGLGTTLSYKNWVLDVMTDFRIGGSVLNSAEHYPTCRGISSISLNARDAAHGGQQYNIEVGGNTYTMNNGLILNGVVEVKDANGNVTGYAENNKVTAADAYYMYTYNWGNSDPEVTYRFSVHENSYWKMRELVLGYNLPKSVISHLSLKNLRISVFGRNLFYMYKTLNEIDPESTGGTSWGNQAGVGYSSSPTRTFGLSLRASF